MDKKINDIIDKIDLCDIHNKIDLDDKEINEILENKNINYLKIRDNILNNISNNNITKVNIKKRILLKNVKPLIAAILIICLSCSVYAYNKGYFEEYFGKNSEKINEGRIHIELNQESDGIILKSADIISGETDANILLVFQRKDGKPFQKTPYILDYKINLSERSDTIGGDGLSTKMSADNTTLTALYNIGEDNKPLKGRKLDINTNCMIGRSFKEYICDTDLDKIYKENTINVKMSKEEHKLEEEKLKKEAKEKGEEFCIDDRIIASISFLRNFKKQSALTKITVPQEISEFVKSIDLTDIGFVNNILYISQKSECIQDNKTERSIILYALYDTRTGKTIYGGGVGPNKKDSSYTAEFNDIKPEELQFFKPIIGYNEEKVISEGSWNLSYTFDSNSSGFYFDKDINIERDIPEEGKIRFTKIEIKPLSFDIICERPDYKPHTSPIGGASAYKVKVILKLDNGEIRELSEGGGIMIGNSGKYFKYVFRLSDKINQKDDIDFFNSEYLEHISSIEIDGTEVYLKDK